MFKHISKKIISFILVLLCIFNLISASVASVLADVKININTDIFNVIDKQYPTVEGYNTIVITANYWLSANIYAWKKETLSEHSAWPGIPMRFGFVNEYGQYQYFAFIPVEYDSCVISNTSLSQQTVDIDIAGNMGVYLSNYSNGLWTVGNWSPDFYDTNDLKIPPKDHDGKYVDIWPGERMNLLENTDNIYYFDIPIEYNYFIFSDGNYYLGFDDKLAWQTDDILFTGGNKLYKPNLSDTAFDINHTFCSVNCSEYTSPIDDNYTRRVYFEAPSSWDHPSCYCWASSDYVFDPDAETNIGFGKTSSYIYNCTAVIGEETKVTVVLKSDEYKIEDLQLEIEDTNVAEIKSISIGEGDYIATENTKVATIYLEAKKIANTSLTATAPDGSSAICKIVVGEKYQSEEEKEIASLINDVEMGPFAMTGATIDVAGYEIPLFEMEATIKMELGNLQIVNDLESNTIQVLLGFDQNASANIDGAQNSTTYWSESYKEVKSMYQSLTGKKVDTTRLWNKYSSLRGKLKKCKANMVIDVSSDLTGYIELKRVGDSYMFSEGGIMASFSADTSIRSYYGPAYVALGLGVNANGNLVFVYENNEINPRINVNPSFIVSIGAGLGTRKTYAEIDAYGTFGAEISSYANDPFVAYLDLGVKWSGYIVGKELFSGEKSFMKTQLYPNFGQDMKMKAIASTRADFSDINYYNNLLNSSKSISREYLNRKFSSKPDISQTGNLSNDGIVSFEKANSYPLSEPTIVSFNNGTALLVWIDDSGEKTDNNMCSLYYSFFDGSGWTIPSELFENGTANDMPYVYSDGTYAYIVWQKADQVFDDEISVTDMIQHFDLYETTFNSADQSFTEPVLINCESNNIFEFNPQIYGTDGSFVVSWIENSDNNILQMSGENILKHKVYNNSGQMILCENVVATEEIISKTILSNYSIYYSLQTDNGSTLYSYKDNTTTKHGEIQDFAITRETLFYLKDGTVCRRIGEQDYKYANLSGLNNFTITDNGESMYLFTLVLNEDFTKSLYYSTYNYDNGSWSMLECYREGDHYIRNYSPSIINDEVFVAYNLITKDSETDCQQSSLIVDAKVDAIDIQLNYVDFSNESIFNNNVNLICELQNNSSMKIEEIEYCIFNENHEIIDSGIQMCEIPSFSITTQVFTIDGLEEYMGDLIKVEILSTNHADYNTTNNFITTSLELIPEYNEYVLGDVDGDNKVNIMDVTEIQRHIAQLSTIPEDRLSCADANRDGQVNIMDATQIQLFIAQLIPEL